MSKKTIKQNFNYILYIPKIDNKKKELHYCNSFSSGYQDSNLGPPAPKAGALTGLRYIPKNWLSNLNRASCRIRTNDPEITNHVLWPTELKRREGSLLYRAATTCYLCCGQALEDSQGAGRIGLPISFLRVQR